MSVPLWQNLAAIGLLVLAIWGMAWVAGRIYRVGILMKGKTPTLPQLFHWIRHGQPNVSDTDIKARFILPLATPSTDLSQMFTRSGGRAGRTALGAALLGIGLGGCGSDSTRTIVRVASTTSLYDTGLLDDLVAAFSEKHPKISVQVVAVGTGQALALGERRDADLVFVHAPDRELEFIAAGHGLRRTTLMRNDFVVVGPESDPAGVLQATDGPDALRRIAASKEFFASRGDDSGTHIRERELWDKIGGRPDEDWYLEVGQGMGATLLFAAERRAYVLTDRATLVVLKSNGVDLVELFAGGPRLQNLYSLMPVTGAAEPGGAATFESWMLSDEAASIIRVFGEQQYGVSLFTMIAE